jgi:hypothetical protein
LICPNKMISLAQLKAQMADYRTAGGHRTRCRIDLLAITPDRTLVRVELKRDRTPR